MQFLAKMLDGKDGSIEAHLVLASLIVIAFVVIAVYSVIWLGHPFDPQAYGVGSAATLGGTGLASWGQGKQRKEEG